MNDRSQHTNSHEKKKPTVATSFLELQQVWESGEPETEAEQEQLDETAEKRKAYTEFRTGTYNVVSIVAYLIGVSREHFRDEPGLYYEDVYKKLDKDKDARIIRNLCRIRNAFEQHYGAIISQFRMGMKNIGNIPEYIPEDAVMALSNDGIQLYKSRPDADEYIIAINIEISNRINKTACFYPEWIKWEYVRPLFIMPKGTKKEGVKEAGKIYNSDRNRYPFHCWINWSAISYSSLNHGNILYNDEKFVRLLYERNEDKFENISLVRDVGSNTMRNLTELLERCEKCIIVVDCENSDAVKLAAALSGLPHDQLDKLKKVLLFDSEYTTDQWKTLVDRSLRMAVNERSRLELEHIVVQRLNQKKSQVDLTLAMRTSREVYKGGVDAVILISSDSDYWAMIQQLEGVSFLVMLEHGKTGLAIKDALMEHEIPFCYIDDFCTNATYSIKTGTLITAIQEQIDGVLSGTLMKTLNVRALMENALADSWIKMSEKEKETFYSRYLLHMKLEVDAEGQVHLRMGGA